MVEVGSAIPSQLDPPTRLPSLQIKRYVAAAQMGSGEQIAFDTGQRRAMTLIALQLRFSLEMGTARLNLVSASPE